VFFAMRRVAVVLAAMTIAGLVLAWSRGWIGAGSDGPHPTRALASSFTRHVDPRGLERASIAGTVRDRAHQPIANARVCVEPEPSDVVPSALTRDPRCVTADNTGAYVIADLLAGDCHVAAMAKMYVPRASPNLTLAEGEHRANVDLELVSGGLEVTGTVTDISGEPIAHALVRATGRERWSSSETDVAGRFSMWVEPDTRELSAVADGYAEDVESCLAPCRVVLRLVPESSLSGTVIDAETGTAMAGVRVIDDRSSPESDITDDDGHFRLTRLPPGRYVVLASSPTRYGRSAGSTLVGFADHHEPIVVRVFPAVRISGRVMIAGGNRRACREATLQLETEHSTITTESDPDGNLHLDGMLPGRYDVKVHCEGFPQHAASSIVVTDTDLTGLEWGIDEGATLRGRVMRKDGTPVTATLMFRSDRGPSRRELARDGAYELHGFATGDLEIVVVPEHGASPAPAHVTIAGATDVVDKDLIVDDGGTIRGSVVDEAGNAAAGVYVIALRSVRLYRMGASGMQQSRTHDDGSFTLEVSPGDYELFASRHTGGQGILRSPSHAEDDSVHVTVAAGRDVTANFVVETMAGAISGHVEDAAGKAVGDAFVTAEREPSDSHVASFEGPDQPVVTRADGTFQLVGLPSGSYTIIAERQSGGEARLEHVAVGGVASLRIRTPASIAGTARRNGRPPDMLAIEVRDTDRGTERSEQFFHTDGSYQLGELPPGNYEITARADGSLTQQVVDLGDGEHKIMDIGLTSNLTVTGRVVDAFSHAPVPGFRMRLSPSEGFDDGANISGADGRFTLRHAPIGDIAVFGHPTEITRDIGYRDLDAFSRTLSGDGTIDLGDLRVMRRRLHDDEPSGTLGFRWRPGGYPPWIVEALDPAAASSGLRMGDEVTTIDGHDITGDDAEFGIDLLEAPPGTTLALGLTRGVTISLVLGPPD